MLATDALMSIFICASVAIKIICGFKKIELMNLKIYMLLFALFTIPAFNTSAQVINKTNNMASFTDKGTQAPKERFTGTVWVNMNVKPEDGYNTNIGTVTFEPKARTNWHSHTSGQLLFVIEGVGYYQEKGKAIQVIKKAMW